MFKLFKKLQTHLDLDYISSKLEKISKIKAKLNVWNVWEKMLDIINFPLAKLSQQKVLSLLVLHEIASKNRLTGIYEKSKQTKYCSQTIWSIRNIIKFHKFFDFHILNQFNLECNDNFEASFRCLQIEQKSQVPNKRVGWLFGAIS